MSEADDNGPDTADIPSVEDAMAVYSADGQADDLTGNDAGAEKLRATLARDPAQSEENAMPHGPS
jgi:hypothetical protein